MDMILNYRLITIEEAIKYHKKVAEEFRQEAEQIGDEDDIHVKYFCRCAKEHEQHAEWFTELVELRSQRSSEFEWCKGCKEHDEENHCCHRLSNFINTQAQEIHDMAYEEGKNERPQGEWIEFDDGSIVCSICKTGTSIKSIPSVIFFRYCPYCGVYMRKGDRNESSNNI